MPYASTSGVGAELTDGERSPELGKRREERSSEGRMELGEGRVIQGSSIHAMMKEQ